MRSFVVAIVIGALLDASACSPLHQTMLDPLKFSSAEHILRTDQAKMHFDLGQELRDAKAGPNGPSGLPNCYNLVQNVNVEITTMDSFARGAVTDNATALQGDINVLRAERADFERDINDFVNDGVARPASEPVTISAITHRIEGAVTGAHKTILAIWADISAAHASAGSLAKGTCRNDAPEGIPPKPPIH
jgi:hypothetical protein